MDNDAFSIGLWADHDDPNNVAYPAAYSAILAVGTPADIRLIDGHYYIDTLAQIPATLHVDDDTAGIAEGNLPIPDDQQLVGLVFVVQWWVATAGGGTACSDILHMIVRADAPDTPNGASMLACPGTQAASSSSTTTLVRPRLTIKKWSSFGRQRGLDLLTSGNKKLLSKGKAQMQLHLLKASLKKK